MTVSSVSVPLRTNFLNLVFKQIAFTTFDVYLGFYGTADDPTDEIPITRVPVIDTEWDIVTAAGDDVYASNNIDVLFSDVPESVINGIVLYDASVDGNIVTASVLDGGALDIPGESDLVFHAGALKFTFGQ